MGRSRSLGYHYGEECEKLCLEKIVCRYEIPRVLVSNNGEQFDNNSFRDFYSQLGIKNHYSSPAHPQANG